MTLGRPQDRDLARANLVTDIQSEVDAAEQGGFDLDEVTAAELEEPPRPAALYDLGDLRSDPAGPRALAARHRGQAARQQGLLLPGARACRLPVRVTTDPELLRPAPGQHRAVVPGQPSVSLSRRHRLQRRATGRSLALATLSQRPRGAKAASAEQPRAYQ